MEGPHHVSLCLLDQTTTAFGAKANLHFRSGRKIERCRRRDQQLLSNVDQVVAVTAEVRLAAHGSAERVGAVGVRVGQKLEIVRLDAKAHLLARAGELALADFKYTTGDLDRVSGQV